MWQTVKPEQHHNATVSRVDAGNHTNTKTVTQEGDRIGCQLLLTQHKLVQLLTHHM
jgi:hypothetical protein